MTVNELIEFCEEEEYGHRIRCKHYDDASGFTRSGNKDIRTACAIREEIKMNYYQQMIDIMRKYQKIEQIANDKNINGDLLRMSQIRWELEHGNDKS